jgi:hypothetical protein
LIVVGIWLHEVDDIKAVDFVLPCIFYLKIVPLGEAICAIVILEVQIVFRVTDFDSFPQVSALKSTLEY